MGSIKSYRNLIVWQKSMEMCTLVYRLTQKFPEEEICGLTSQLRRASVSVAVNIAEGHGRNSKNEYRHFIGIAKGSLAEMESMITLSQILRYSSENEAREILGLSTEVSKMLSTINKKLSPSP